ncbi:MAG: sugar transferase, partial [Lachnospiraceae bacterium]|nr:sugar transferase [Lachnospiraceae bacterium]
ILKGDMSLVGPRPLLVKYLPWYSEEEAHRHDVRPGLTGLAQVNGRNAISWEDKFRYDVKYVDNITFKGDMDIIFKTVKSVLHREGISSETCATMEEFMGNGEQ